MRMAVRYHRRRERLVPDYVCHIRTLQYRDAPCQVIPGGDVDAAMGQLLVDTMTPMTLELTLAVQAELEARIEETDRLRGQQVERANMTSIARGKKPKKVIDRPDAASLHLKDEVQYETRSFGLDVLACPRCGGRLRLIALIEEAAVIQRILRHLGLPTAIPPPRSARAPPLAAGAPNQAGWDDDLSVFDSGC